MLSPQRSRLRETRTMVKGSREGPDATNEKKGASASDVFTTFWGSAGNINFEDKRCTNLSGDTPTPRNWSDNPREETDLSQHHVTSSERRQREDNFSYTEQKISPTRLDSGLSKENVLNLRELREDKNLRTEEVRNLLRLNDLNAEKQ